MWTHLFQGHNSAHCSDRSRSHSFTHFSDHRWIRLIHSLQWPQAGQTCSPTAVTTAGSDLFPVKGISHERESHEGRDFGYLRPGSFSICTACGRVLIASEQAPQRVNERTASQSSNADFLMKTRFSDGGRPWL